MSWLITKVQTFFVLCVEPFLPKFLKRLWCNHKGTLVADPDPNDLIDMSEICVIKCKCCGRQKPITLYKLLFGTDLEGWFNANL